MRDILGGKGAGLAEMTNAGLPVPPGFTISTAACTIYYEQRARFPPTVDQEMLAELKRLESRLQGAVRVDDESAAGLGAVGREVLDARHDGHDPQPRAQRHDGRSAQGADAERPLRVRQLSPLHPDVRQRRPRDRQGRVRARADGGEEGHGRQPRIRSSTRAALREVVTRYKGVVKEHDEAGLSAGRRSISCGSRATPCSARGRTRARRSTAASTRSPTRSAPPSTCR